MQEIVVNGRIEFCLDGWGDFNRAFCAVLQKGRVMGIGYATAVTITYGVTSSGIIHKPDFVDISYDRSIKFTEDDFKDWLRRYFKVSLSKHNLIFS